MPDGVELTLEDGKVPFQSLNLLVPSSIEELVVRLKFFSLAVMSCRDATFDGQCRTSSFTYAATGILPTSEAIPSFWNMNDDKRFGKKVDYVNVFEKGQTPLKVQLTFLKTSYEDIFYSSRDEYLFFKYHEAVVQSNENSAGKALADCVIQAIAELKKGHLPSCSPFGEHKYEDPVLAGVKEKPYEEWLNAKRHLVYRALAKTKDAAVMRPLFHAATKHGNLDFLTARKAAVAIPDMGLCQNAETDKVSPEERDSILAEELKEYDTNFQSWEKVVIEGKAEFQMEKDSYHGLEQAYVLDRRATLLAYKESEGHVFTSCSRNLEWITLSPYDELNKNVFVAGGSMTLLPHKNQVLAALINTIAQFGTDETSLDNLTKLFQNKGRQDHRYLDCAFLTMKLHSSDNSDVVSFFCFRKWANNPRPFPFLLTHFFNCVCFRNGSRRTLVKLKRI